MTEVKWNRYPTIASDARARAWLGIQADLGRATNTVEACGRGLEDFLQFIDRAGVQHEAIGRAHVAAYVRELSTRPNLRAPRIRRLTSGHGLSNATLQQRLTVVRLYYDYLMEEGIRPNNPVGRGSTRRVQRLEERGSVGFSPTTDGCRGFPTMTSGKILFA